MTTDPADLPHRGESHRQERDGVLEVEIAVTKQLRWILREQPILDYGVDAHFEVVSENDRVTGRLIGAQIKSGESYLEPVAGGWNFTKGKLKHYNYWLGHSLPIVLILHDPRDDKLYWQVVDETTATVTGAGFKVFVPASNVLDISAKPKLEDLARRAGAAALAVYDGSLQLLPWAAVRALRTAETADRTGAARLAQLLADGRVRPTHAVQQVLAAKPSWLVDSAAAVELWAATAGFANAHGLPDLAIEAFDRCVEVGGPQAARRRALAGWTLIGAGRRDEARAYLDQAKTDGAVVLADVGLAALAIPADDAQQVEAPPSLLEATDAEIDAEPALVNFLAEQRVRAGDIDGAVALIRRVVDGVERCDASMRLRLAELLRRRIQEHAGYGGPDSVEARRYARSALEEYRCWCGPSENALGELLDLEILDGDLITVVELALPAAAGGRATEREANAPEIARRGATAALLCQRHDALTLFRQILEGDPYLAQLDAQKLEIHGGDVDELRRAWQHALDVAVDDRSLASCSLRLADLGVWPIPKAENLLARSIIPEWSYRLAEAVARAATGDPGGAMTVLRALAQDRIDAALRLVMVIEQYEGATAAAHEWRQQYDQWQDVALADVLPNASWTGDDGIPSLIADLLADQRMSGDARARLRRRFVHHLRENRQWDRVARVCRAGLQERPDDYLAWSFALALHETHRVPDARAALAQHRPALDSEQQARLWARLHIGVDLDNVDAVVAADLAERFSSVPALAEQLTTFLRREQHRRRRDDVPEWPREFQARVDALTTAIFGADDPDAVAETTVAQRLGEIGYERLEDLRRKVEQGHEPLAALASLARSPYGKMLLLRTVGMTLATDPEPGIAAVGVSTAREALARREVVMDQSAYYLQLLLGRDGEQLRMRFAKVHVPATGAVDASNTRDSVWATTAAEHTFGVHNGQLRRETIPAARRARLRSLAAELEQVTTRAIHHEVAPSAGPAHDAIELARRLGIALYADDVVLRQLARAHGVPAFGTSDLITATDTPTAHADEMTRRLAAEYVVDLPLDGDDLAQLETDGEWRGAGRLNLSRSQWWTHMNAASLDAWRAAARAAALISNDNLVVVTKYALHGALYACSPGHRTQRYLQVVVAALDSIHEAGLQIPDDFLDALKAATVENIAPGDRFVFRALIDALHARGVDDATGVAADMLPEVAADAATWG
ncbi:hypothetical protein DKT69_25730 [Micromonospora sicca]|uniref:Uncharacterized protein n=1 Tax=Micromonospora sicca TaxID=2202420 RepID=A0A317DGE9_9ACTN|nr:DUF4365 domain-containing protein [Micromonospora sp. 4G51]PWR11833.1 hypothetical protein DKT69_25730 [Micromonospora sp. 4G51]